MESSKQRNKLENLAAFIHHSTPQFRTASANLPHRDNQGRSQTRLQPMSFQMHPERSSQKVVKNQ